MAVAFAASLLAPSLGWNQEKTKQKSPAQSEAKKSTEKKEPIDINTASEEELKSIKGIGDVYAKKIVDGRPYKRKDELVSRKILPEKTYDQVKGQIVAKQTKETTGKTSAEKPSEKK
jgi:DNA uptake protein ComE-like DNA-binding protein